METTKEEREWLRLNWSVDDPTFRQWVSGSDHAHALVPRVLHDVATLEKALSGAASRIAHAADYFEKGEATVENAGLYLKAMREWAKEARAVLGEE